MSHYKDMWCRYCKGQNWTPIPRKGPATAMFLATYYIRGTEGIVPCCVACESRMFDCYAPHLVMLRTPELDDKYVAQEILND